MFKAWRGRSRDVRRALDLRKLKGARLPDFKDVRLPELHAPEIDWASGRMGARAGALWPTLFAAAGAGVAFWWWNQWARGQAEAAAQPSLPASDAEGQAPDPERHAEDLAGGLEGAAHPELVMAHAPEPAVNEGEPATAQPDSSAAPKRASRKTSPANGQAAAPAGQPRSAAKAAH